jgi:hypothetical protein
MVVILFLEISLKIDKQKLHVQKKNWVYKENWVYILRYNVKLSLTMGEKKK